MFSSYRAVFAREGAWKLAISGGLGWLSFASHGLALVLAVEASTGSFASAGVVVAAFGMGSATLAPVRGRIVDRRGPGTLQVLATAQAAALGAVVAGCVISSSVVVPAVASGLAGACAPPLIATARSVWPTVTGPDLAGTGHAVNGALGDAAQVLGPALTGVIAVLVCPAAALAALIPGVLVGSILLSRTAPSQPPPPEAPRGGASVWGVLGERAGLRVVVACELLLGMTFGALDVAAPVVADAAGAAELAALPLAVFAVGSVGVSVWSGAVTVRPSAAWRYRAGCGVVATALLPCLASAALPAVTLALVVAGAGYGLLNVALFELLEDLAPADRAVEAFTWITSWSAAGLAAGAAVAGMAGGAGPAMVVVVLPSAAAVLVAIAGHPAYRVGRARSPA